MRRVDPYRTEIYTAEQIDEMLSHIAPSETYSKLEIDAMVSDINDDIDTKQDILTAGDNVAISEQNVISATDTKYTAGTGILIDADNVISAIGSAGGDWSLRTPNNDWSDIFSIDDSDNYLSAKKDLLIRLPQYTNCIWYIPKNVRLGVTFSLLDDIIQVDNVDSNTLKMGHNIEISYTNISSGTQIPVRYSKVSFTISNNAISMSVTRPNQNFMKTAFQIYTKD